MNRFLAAACLLAVLCGAGPAALAAEPAEAIRIVDGPRVEVVGDTWAEIAWSTNVGGSTVVRYGTDPDALHKTATAPYMRTGNVHRVRVKDLKPATTYYFVAQSAQGRSAQAKSEAAPFDTKPKGSDPITYTSAPQAPVVSGPQSTELHREDEAATAVYRDPAAASKPKM